MSRFHRLRFRVAAENEELLIGWLWAAGVEGLSSDALPGGDVVVDATFCEEKLSVKGVLRDLETKVPGIVLLDSGAVEDHDWLAAWRDSAEPIELGQRLIVDPREWEPAPEAPPWIAAGGPRAEGATRERFVLRIPARTAFGVGSHESTRLAYQLLEATDLDGKRVLDVGCGSGILAMAALRLGAASAIGFDFDPAAALLAGQYARHNDSAARFYLGTIASLAARSRFDVVVLNVLPHEIADELAEVVAALAPGGPLLVSGVLAVEAAAVVEAISARGCASAGSIAAGEWVGLRFLKRRGLEGVSL
jgi:ribosomal protein L11 methyltransferase